MSVTPSLVLRYCLCPGSLSDAERDGSEASFYPEMPSVGYGHRSGPLMSSSIGFRPHMGDTLRTVGGDGVAPPARGDRRNTSRRRPRHCAGAVGAQARAG